MEVVVADLLMVANRLSALNERLLFLNSFSVNEAETIECFLPDMGCCFLG